MLNDIFLKVINWLPVGGSIGMLVLMNLPFGGLENLVFNLLDNLIFIIAIVALIASKIINETSHPDTDKYKITEKTYLSACVALVFCLIINSINSNGIKRIIKLKNNRILKVLLFQLFFQ